MKIQGETSTRTVWVDGVELSPERSQLLYLHSHDGYSWGYNGSGPAQLALAILLQAGFSDSLACDLHQEFKREIIAPLDWDKDFYLEIKFDIPEAAWEKLG